MCKIVLGPADALLHRAMKIQSEILIMCIGGARVAIVPEEIQDTVQYTQGANKNNLVLVDREGGQERQNVCCHGNMNAYLRSGMFFVLFRGIIDNKTCELLEG